MIPWEKQIGREAEWWFSHGSKNMAVQSHTDFFEHIYTTYAKTLHTKAFKMALEIGPGASGGYLAVMPNIGKRISLDPISEELDARGFLPFRSHIRYITGFAENMPFGNNSFDLVIVSNALDHVKDMHLSMKEIKRVLKPGGLVFFFTFLDVNPPHPWTFKTIKEILDLFDDFDILESHSIKDTRVNNFMRRRNPYFVAVFQLDKEKIKAKKKRRELLDYGYRYRSQNGEDGILEEIFRRLGIEHGWYVDVGAWDGQHLSNTYMWFMRGWNGIGIEIDEGRYNAMIRLSQKYPGRLLPFHRRVTLKTNNLEANPPEETLISILSKTVIPRDFDLLNIDIDSYDRDLWNGLYVYEPKVVVIETTGKLGSFLKMVGVAKRKGYSLVCYIGNCIFVRNDQIEKLNLNNDDIADPRSLFFTLKEFKEIREAMPVRK